MIRAPCRGRTRFGTLSLRYIAKPQEIRFFLMRATELGPAWERHLESDALLADPVEVAAHLSFKEYRRFWRRIEHHVLDAVRSGNG
jgi:hypothetical protein